MAEWSKALESGCYGNLSSPKGRGFEPHFCHTDILFPVVAVGSVQLPLFCGTVNSEQYFKSSSKAQCSPLCHFNILGWKVEKQELNVISYRL